MKSVQRIVLSLSMAAMCLSGSVFAEAQAIQSKEDIQKIVKEYLLDNPEILVQVAQRYQQKQAEMQQKMAEQAIIDNAAALFQDKNSPTSGNDDAKVVMVEFFDYQCGHCKHMNSVVKSLISSNKDLQVVYKELPIFGGESLTAAKYALAANKAGQYDAVHDAFMNERTKFTSDKLDALLEKAGVDKQKLGDASELAQYNSVIDANKELAAKLGIRGTPAFVIATNVGKPTMQVKFIPGAAGLERLQSVINELKAS